MEISVSNHRCGDRFMVAAWDFRDVGKVVIYSGREGRCDRLSAL